MTISNRLDNSSTIALSDSLIDLNGSFTDSNDSYTFNKIAVTPVDEFLNRGTDPSLPTLDINTMQAEGVNNSTVAPSNPGNAGELNDADKQNLERIKKSFPFNSGAEALTNSGSNGTAQVNSLSGLVNKGYQLDAANPNLNRDVSKLLNDAKAVDNKFSQISTVSQDNKDQYSTLRSQLPVQLKVDKPLTTAMPENLLKQKAEEANPFYQGIAGFGDGGTQVIGNSFKAFPPTTDIGNSILQTNSEFNQQLTQERGYNPNGTAAKVGKGMGKGFTTVAAPAVVATAAVEAAPFEIPAWLFGGLGALGTAGKLTTTDKLAKAIATGNAEEIGEYGVSLAALVNMPLKGPPGGKNASVPNTTTSTPANPPPPGPVIDLVPTGPNQYGPPNQSGTVKPSGGGSGGGNTNTANTDSNNLQYIFGKLSNRDGPANSAVDYLLGANDSGSIVVTSALSPRLNDLYSGKGLVLFAHGDGSNVVASTDTEELINTINPKTNLPRYDHNAYDIGSQLAANNINPDYIMLAVCEGVTAARSIAITTGKPVVASDEPLIVFEGGMIAHENGGAVPSFYIMHPDGTKQPINAPMPDLGFTLNELDSLIRSNLKINP